jgi:hypothetical protein
MRSTMPSGTMEPIRSNYDSGEGIRAGYTKK